MNTIQIILTWFGVGVAVGLGIVAVVFVAIKLSELYYKLFPKNKQPEVETLEKELNAMGRDYIVLSYDMKVLIEPLKERLKQFRSKLWSRDYVLPNVSIGTAKFPKGKHCMIRLEGKELFNGDVEQTLPNEAKVDFILKQIEIFYASKMIAK